MTQILDLFSLERSEWGGRRSSEGVRDAKVDYQRADVQPRGPKAAEPQGGSRTLPLGWRLFELSQTLLDTTEFRMPVYTCRPATREKP